MLAAASVKHGTSSPVDHYFDACKPLARNLLPHPTLDALDPPGAETDILWFGGGNLVHGSNPLYTSVPKHSVSAQGSSLSTASFYCAVRAHPSRHKTVSPSPTGSHGRTLK